MTACRFRLLVARTFSANWMCAVELEVGGRLYQEAAAKLSISVKTLFTSRMEGKIHYQQPGTNIRFSLGDILEYKERCIR